MPTPRYRIRTETGGYYEQFITVEGITVKANSRVQADPMYDTADIIGGMMRSLRDDIQRCLVRTGAEMAISPDGEYITTLPEFRYLKGKFNKFAGVFFDEVDGKGAEGIGQPVGGVIEANLLRGSYSVVVHEFAHAVQNLCFSQDEHDEWDRYYRRAKEADLFPGAYGMTHPHEFFAEFTESFFDRPSDTQWDWDPEDEELTRQKLSADFPEIFSSLKGIYEGWEVGSYFGPNRDLQDRDALTALYNSTDGPNWANSENWLSDAP